MEEKPQAGDLISRTIEAVKANPGSPELRNNLGVLYFKGGHIEEAIKEFAEAVRLKPDFAKALTAAHVRHTYIESPGGHNWALWRGMAWRAYLAAAGRLHAAAP
jgi:tetratricopeptide (TPR) repeat protein